MPMPLPAPTTLSRRSSLLATCLLAACSPFSTHAPPSSVVVPSHFSQAPAGEASDLSAWWRAWNDPALTLAIENALKANPDLRIARDHILQAEATQAVARSTLGPTLGITGNIAGGGMDWRNPYNLPARDAGTDGHLAGLAATWEPDLFGGRHAETKAAHALVLAEQARLHGVQMAIAADVATNYVQVQSLRKQLALLEDSLSTLSRLKTYAQARFDAGQAVLSDIQSVDEKINTLRARRPLLETAVNTSLRRMAILAGQAPENTTVAVSVTPLATPPAPTGDMPDTVLRRRPDVAAAEDLISARLYHLKSTKTDLLPRFGLQFFGGDGRLRFDGIPGLSGTGGLVALTSYLPIFTSGRIHARIAAADAQLDEAVATYDKTLLSALADVENAYEARTSEDLRIQELSAALKQSQANGAAARGLYEGGQRTLHDILEARLDTLSVENTLTQAIAQQQIATITLSYALGGGWH